MKRIIYILSLLCANLLVFGQAVPFTVVPTSSSQEIVIGDFDSISYNGGLDIIGDAIGAFYLQDETPTCAGFLQFDGVANTFTVYGNDAVDNGFMNGETMQFKYWRKSSNCIVSITDFFLNEYTYSANGSDTILKAAARPALVGFSSNFFCKKNTAVLPIPLVVQNLSILNLGVSVNPVLPGYDNSTKQILNFNGADGDYNFTFNTLDGVCIVNSAATVRISSALNNTPDVSVVPPTCAMPEGRVVVDTSQLNLGKKPFILKLKAERTGFEYVSLSGIFNTIPADNYKLIIEDQNSCGDTLSVEVPVNNSDCLGVRDIITPNSNNEFAELYLPWTGETRIYNYQWQLVNSLNTPMIWNGRDAHGSLLTSGVYFVFTNGKKMKEITVVNEYVAK